MSNWTHVAGVVRIDCITAFMVNKNVDFHNIFGKELDFYDDSDVWEDAEENPSNYLPMGSEGSLKISVWENPRDECAARYTVSIFGDLRDHDSAEEIVEWFKNKIDEIEEDMENGIWIRQACITVDNEWYRMVSWNYGEDKR